MIAIDIHLGDKAIDLRTEMTRTTHLDPVVTRATEGVNHHHQVLPPGTMKTESKVHHQLLTVLVLGKLRDVDLGGILGQIHQKTEQIHHIQAHPKTEQIHHMQKVANPLLPDHHLLLPNQELPLPELLPEPHLPRNGRMHTHSI